MDTDRPKARSNLLILLCVSIPSFMINLDANIVAVSLPSISQSLHADFTAIEWVISAYTLTFAALVLPSGTLADLYGRKRILIVGLAIFTLASLVCGAAPNAAVLNTARAVQGVGAALQLSAALALLSFEFQGPARARAFAFWGTVIGVAITLGPLIGGIITRVLGWEWAFYINIPVGVAMIALTATSVKESSDPNAKSLDTWGFLSFSAALGLLTYALISGNHAGWSSPRILAEFAGAAICFAIFMVVEATHSRPMLDLGFFRKPTYIGANIAGIAYAFTLLTMLTFLPLFFQSGLGLSPQASGLFMLPMAVPIFVMPRIVSRYLTHRLSGRTILTIGLSLSSVGLLLLSATVTSLSYAAMLPAMMVVGISAGFLNGETAKVSMTVIPPDRAGMAAGVGGTIRFAGIVIGFATFGAVLFNTVAAVLAKSMGIALDAQALSSIQRLVAGDNGALGSLGDRATVASGVAAGYQAVFLLAALLAGFAAAAAWLLVKQSDTPATPQHSRASAGEPLPVE